MNPLLGVTDTVDDPVVPELKLTGLEAEIVKSGEAFTVNVMLTEWERPIIVPVITTVFVPVVANVQERLEVPESVTVVVDRLHSV